MEYKKIEDTKLSDHIYSSDTEKRKEISLWLESIVNHIKVSEKYIKQIENMVKANHTEMCITSIYYCDEKFPMPVSCTIHDIKKFSDNKTNTSISGYYFPITSGYFEGWTFVFRWHNTRLDVLLIHNLIPMVCSECHIGKEICPHKSLCIIM